MHRTTWNLLCSCMSQVLERLAVRAGVAPKPARDLAPGLAEIVNFALTQAMEAPQADGIAPLESIFNHLNGRGGRQVLRANWAHETVQYPVEEAVNTEEDYRELLARWEALSGRMPWEADYASCLLDAMESCFSHVPESGAAADRRDVPLYLACRAAAAIGCAAERYAARKPASRVGRHDSIYRLWGFDLSGIQAFIYTISNRGALKGLRSRSFYLSVLMEHLVDEALDRCGLSRANVVYVGGGKAYLLLQDTEEAQAAVSELIREANRFLLERFGGSLYLASGWACASAAELCGSGKRGYSAIFSEVSRMISRRKLNRYSAEDIRRLNAGGKGDGLRECVICGHQGELVTRSNGEALCGMCSRLEAFSREVAGLEVLLVSREEKPDALPLPGGCWLRSETLPEAQNLMNQGAVRCYPVNAMVPELPRAHRLHVGNYQAAGENGLSVTFADLAARSCGVKRLGVMRMDVDNLGSLFAGGLRMPGTKAPDRYVTLPRYMALSTAISTFFQREINAILGQAVTQDWLGNMGESRPLEVAVVYSGGDDVFIIGAWNDIMEAGLRLEEAFSRYTGGAVTLSGGMGIYHGKEPVSMMAESAGQLENAAKAHVEAGGGKNAIALFGEEESGGSPGDFAFRWTTLRERVLTKLPMLARHFTLAGDSGNGALYQILTCLRDMKDDESRTGNPMAIARLAYTLARRMEQLRIRGDEASLIERDALGEAVQQILRWAEDEEENRALRTAILLHVYANRKENTQE